MTLRSQQLKSRFLGVAVTAAIGMLLGATTLATEACTITTSDKPLDFGDSGIGNTGDTGTKGPDTSSLSCNECLFQGCTNVWAVCQNDAECRAIYQCSTQPNANVTACFCTHTVA